MDDDWEDLVYEDDFESRYADELEVLNELDDDEYNNVVKPKSRGNNPRKSLVFLTPEKPKTTYLTQQSVVNNVSDVTQGYKRQIDQMYAALSDGEESENESGNSNNDSSPSQHRNQAKRARIDSSLASNTISAPRDNLIPDTRVLSHQMSPTQSVETHQVFVRPPVGDSYVSLTGIDGGRRVFLHIAKDESKQVTVRKSCAYRHGMNLLGVPISAIKETIYEERRNKLLEESKQLTDTLHSVLTDDQVDSENCVTSQEVSENDEDKSLWVDKYSPHSYMDLLSDDGINRNLLSWLKLWDGVVFGKDRRKKKDVENNKKKGKKINYKEDCNDWMELDATGRPSHKVALLCGAPGLGKTTLAHIVAQHAGYSVVEMNASDDRSAEVFRNKIESTTQMQSVLDSGKRPNCLIIDEIDGAPTPAINVLLSVIKTKESGVVKSITYTPKYVPALRQLRQQAFVLFFPPTIPGRLAQRLLQVSKNESLETNTSTLLALCEKTENDVRSCLNTLQFLRQKQKQLTIEYIQSANIGQKDTQKSLFSLWQAVFQLPRAKNKRLATLAKPLSEPVLTLPEYNVDDSTKNPDLTSSAARFYNMLHLASSNGQYTKLENGIFENYLNMKFKDSYLNQVVLATDWLQFTDLLSQCLHQNQSFILMRYQPFLSVAFHMLFAAPIQPKISYPSLAYENTLKETRIRNIMTSMLCDVSPQLRGNLDVQRISVELLPLLLHIITPTLRPINTQLFSSSEKQQMIDLIHIMIAYNITYTQERNVEGQYTYVSEPKIEDVVKFPGLPQHKQLTYAMKQLIAREIDLEKMRITERMIYKNSSKDKKQKDSMKKKANEFDGDVDVEAQKSNVILHLKPKELKAKKEKPSQAKDFFGRPIVIHEQTDSNGHIDKNSKKHSPFWFKFQEGFSNAVRRPAKIQDLL